MVIHYQCYHRYNDLLYLLSKLDVIECRNIHDYHYAWERWVVETQKNYFN